MTQPELSSPEPRGTKSKKITSASESPYGSPFATGTRRPDSPTIRCSSREWQPPERTVAVAVRPPDGPAPLDGPLDAPLDTHFGRARAFVCAGPDGGAAELIVNEHIDAAHGAGTAVVGLLAGRGVRAVVAADFGPLAWRALEAARMEAWKAPEGTPARACLERLRAGALERMTMDVYE